VLIAGLNATTDKQFTGINDSSDKLLSFLLLLATNYCIVIDTGDYALSQIFIDLMMPVNNLSRLSRLSIHPAMIYRR